MAKIYPIGPVIFNNKGTLKSLVKSDVQKPLFYVKTLAAASFGASISTFLKDYSQTEKNNWFQFKTNPETRKPYSPDIFQKAAAMNLYIGNDVLVTAPTGTGKTAIAEYVISKNLKNRVKTFYTTPLKALSNEKYLAFCKTYGKENVGLLTGDTKINTEAPIIIMTTEVYRNMAATDKFDLYKEEKGIPKDLKTVIFDELQYLGDVDRGGIWEQSIMFTPKNVQILSLSATIGNKEEINKWIASTKGENVRSVTPESGYLPHKIEKPESVLVNVPPENRHVPLTFQITHAAAETKTPRNLSKKEKIKAKQDAARKSQSLYAQPDRAVYKTLTERLMQENKLPAIYFIFSKKESRSLLRYLSEESEILTTNKEQDEIARIIKRYLKNGIYLGESLNTEALLKGYAIHNAGLLPSQKSLIEELFQKKLIKVVIATETLSAGINMPAKTTVISSPRKPSSTPDGGEDRKRNLTPNEFHQMAGRAGRRGIDTEGFCIPVSCNQVQTKFYQDLIDSPSNPLESNMDLDYSFIANYISEFTDETELRYILSKSLFAYNHETGTDKNKLNEMIKSFRIKYNIMKSDKFFDENSRLTTKGQLLKKLNGYEQIPIINILSNKNLSKLNPIQIAGLIGGLANIEYNQSSNLPQKPFEVNQIFGETFVKAANYVNGEVKSYDRKSKDLFPERDLCLSPKTIEHLATWAALNDREPNSKANWKYLFKSNLKFSIKDEGSLFKEINATVDLLKQLSEAASEGISYAKNDDDKEYFKFMKNLFADAINLIQREPVDADFS